jgi:hypothetical protein
MNSHASRRKLFSLGNFACARNVLGATFGLASIVFCAQLSFATNLKTRIAMAAQPKTAIEIEPELPRNENAELSILGAILQDDGVPNRTIERVLEEIDGVEFYNVHHARAFAAMREMAAKGCAIDIITLADWLRKTGKLAEAGGGDFISGLDKGVPKRLNADYLRIIKEQYSLRCLAYAARSIEQSALDAEEDPGDLIDRARLQLEELREMSAPRAVFVAPTIADLLAKAPAKPECLIEGLIYKGMTTATLGKIKVGKTTFKLKMIGAIHSHQPFLKLETTPTTVLYVTEQGMESFLAQAQKAQLSECAVRGTRLITHTDLIGMNWPARARLIGQQAAVCQAGLAVVDTFSRVALVKDENDAGEMQAAVDILQNFIPKGTALDLTQHERKSGGEIEDAGRGTSALGGCADVLLRISRVAGMGQDRRRDIQTISRPWTAFEEPQRIELQDDGFYSVVGAVNGCAGRDIENKIPVLLQGGLHLTLDEVIERTEGSRSNVQRALDNLIRDGIVCSTGEGKKGSPKRYRGVEI